MSNDEYQTKEFWKDKFPICAKWTNAKLIPQNEVPILPLNSPGITNNTFKLEFKEEWFTISKNLFKTNANKK